MSLKILDLRADIFGASADPLAERFAAWVLASPRFRVFAETYRDKVRKKLRVLRDAEGHADLALELAVAYLLLSDRRFTVEYEKLAAVKQRGPDFTATYRTHTLVHVEVKRLRAAGTDTASRCADVVCEKLRQLQPRAFNVLVMGLPENTASALDLPNALRGLRERAERKDEPFFQRRGFTDARAFLRHYQRLSAVAVRDPHHALPLWSNPLAQPPLTDDLRRTLATTLTGILP